MRNVREEKKNLILFHKIIQAINNQTTRILNITVLLLAEQKGENSRDILHRFFHFIGSRGIAKDRGIYA